MGGWGGDWGCLGGRGVCEVKKGGAGFGGV